MKRSRIFQPENVFVSFVSFVAIYLLAACTSTHSQSAAKNPADPDARTFSGVIVRLAPETSTMRITKDEKVGNDRIPNWITVKYDAQTKFFLDGKPATLDQLAQYMSVSIEGHMRDGQCFAETARFSTAPLKPANN